MDRDVAQGPNAAFAKEALDLVAKCGAETDQLLQSATERIATALHAISGIRTKLATMHKQQEMAFRALIEKHEQAQGQAAERAQLERRRNELLTKNRQRQQLAEQLITLEANRKELLLRLSELWDERFSIREAVALRINAHLSPAIQVSVTQYGNPERYVRLLDSDNPLLVDQPENNLDNRFIFEAVVHSIRKVKPRRQMIFVTHNPNIPVLGDAERVFVLGNRDRNPAAAKGTDSPDQKRPFAGGDLVFYPDRIELCGVRIISDRGADQCMQVLDELRRRESHGGYVHRSGEELAQAICVAGGASVVAGCVRRIRDNVSERLKKERRLTCQRDAVICTNEQGYSMREWITVREG